MGGSSIRRHAILPVMPICHLASKMDQAHKDLNQPVSRCRPGSGEVHISVGPLATSRYPRCCIGVVSGMEIRLSEHEPVGPRREGTEPQLRSANRRSIVILAAALAVLGSITAIAVNITSILTWFGVSPGESLGGPGTQTSAVAPVTTPPGSVPSAPTPTTSKGSGPARETSTPVAIPPPTPTDAASFSNIVNGAKVGKCARLAGTADLAPRRTILWASYRTTQPEGVYYFSRMSAYKNGSVPASWTGVHFFGDQPGQNYDLYLLIMDVDHGEAFWNAHDAADGSFAFADALPSTAKVASRISVTQTTRDEC
jgi:hypothetical protein